MGIIRIMERGGDELYEYKKALKMAKHAIDTICDLTSEMEEEYSERDDSYDWDDRPRVRRYKHVR